jgi:hypothetical protein
VRQRLNIAVVEHGDGTFRAIPLECTRRQLLDGDTSAISSLRQQLDPLLGRIRKQRAAGQHAAISFTDESCWADPDRAVRQVPQALPDLGIQ